MSKEKFVRDKPHVNIGTIALMVFGVISAISLGMVIYVDIMEERDSDGDSIPDLAEGNSGHPLFFNASDDALFFRTYETTTGNHEVGHNLDIFHGGLSSHVNVQLSLHDDVSTGIPVLDFNIKYDSLIEFFDDNGNGFFDPATDTVIGKTTLNNMSRLGFGFGVDGEPAYYSSYSTLNGVLKVDFYTAKEHVLLARQVGLLNPFELKSSITITEYTPITGGTHLALNLSLSSNHNITFSGTTLSAKSSIGNYEVKYEWYDSAIINNVERKVNTTVPSSPIPLNIGSIYINFGEVINGTYDPKLHWQIPRPSSFSITDLPWSYITIGSIGLLAIGMTVKKKTADKVPRKKPGRVTYQPATTSGKSAETTTESEKRIPDTLRHRDR